MRALLQSRARGLPVELWSYPLLVVVGCVAGFMNVMAGGGSLLTLPVMIFMGLPPAAANGTNRVALLAQNITAVSRFRRKGFSDFRLSLTLALCTLPGALAGAIVAVRIDPLWFKRLLALVMLWVLFLMLRGSKRDRVEGEEGPRRTVWAHLSMVGAGFYGGFIQAGVGFILMAILHRLLHLDLVRVNMHKVFIVGLYTLPALAVFILTDQVWWLMGLALAVGNTAGAWIAAHVAVTRGEGVIRAVFAAAVVAMAIRLVIG